MAENFKTDFFTDRIGRGIQDIFQAQLDIATKRIYQKGRERKKVQGTGEIIPQEFRHQILKQQFRPL